MDIVWIYTIVTDIETTKKIIVKIITIENTKEMQCD